MWCSTVGGIVTLLLSLLAAPLAAEAQQPKHVPRLGFLSAGSAERDQSRLVGLQQGLHDSKSTPYGHNACKISM